jgi:hypothetical protein
MAGGRSKTQRFARWVTDHRFPLALALLGASLFFAARDGADRSLRRPE